MEKLCTAIAFYFALAVCILLPVTAFCAPTQPTDTKPGQEPVIGAANSVVNTQQLLVASNQTEAWRVEFDRICAQTEIATGLSKMQLEKLIDDTNELLNQLKEVKDPWAKVYIFRLNKCLDFFKFTLEWLEMQSASSS